MHARHVQPPIMSDQGQSHHSLYYLPESESPPLPLSRPHLMSWTWELLEMGSRRLLVQMITLLHLLLGQATL